MSHGYSGVVRMSWRKLVARPVGDADVALLYQAVAAYDALASSAGGEGRGGGGVPAGADASAMRWATHACVNSCSAACIAAT